MKVVQAGCGAMARRWAELARDHDRIELVGLVDIDRDAAERLRAALDLDAAVFGTLAEALRVCRPDAVFDVTPPEAHEAVTLEALAAGCHVLGEKPMAPTLDAGRRMVAAAERAGRVYAVTQTRRAVPGAQTVARMVREGRIGAVAEVHADFFRGPHFGGFREQMRYPLLLDMAIHHFDLARLLTGCHATGVWTRSFNPAHSWFGHDASAVCVFEMTRRVTFVYRGSWCAIGLPTSWNGSWRIIGQHGSITWDGEGRIELACEADDSPQVITPTRMTHEHHAALIHDFVDAIEAGRAPMCPAQDNLRSLAMVLAATESGEKAAVVPVAEA